MGAHVASHAVFVPDLGAALKYYSDVLGFSVAAYFGDHAVLVRSDVELHLCGYQEAARPASARVAYIVCDDVDGCYAELKSRGATLLSPPQHRGRGVPHFVAIDPDGNRLTFAAR